MTSHVQIEKSLCSADLGEPWQTWTRRLPGLLRHRNVPKRTGCRIDGMDPALLVDSGELRRSSHVLILTHVKLNKEIHPALLAGSGELRRPPRCAGCQDYFDTEVPTGSMSMLWSCLERTPRWGGRVSTRILLLFGQGQEDPSSFGPFKAPSCSDML